MTFSPADSPFFTPDHRKLASAAEEFSLAEIEPNSAERPDTIAQALDFLQRLAKGGWLRYTVPGAYGGIHPQLEVRSLALIRCALARHSGLADVMFAMQGLGSFPITLAGSGPLQQAYLPRVANGQAVAAFALTEPQAGSDAAAMESTARRDSGDYVLDGTKRFISNAGIADFYTVFAKTDPAQGRKGISAFVVEKDRPGFEVVRQMEVIAPHPIGEVRLKNCRVPAENLLGAEGDGYKILLQTLGTFRTTVGAAAVGFAERALQEATMRAKNRVQFGKPLSELQGIRFMLAEMATELEAARLLVFQSAFRLDQALRGEQAGSAHLSDPSVVLASSMAKLYATEAAQRVIDQALQIHGGLGVMKGSVVERLYREVRPLRVYEGTSEIQKEIIAHQVLKS
jgi:acyl-CoA dehydrogenase